jgi:hypothetical protein
MQEISKAEQEGGARPAQFDFTDQQGLCCPKCRGEDIAPIEGPATWDEGRYWECTVCRIVFEVRQIARELGPVAAWL